MNLVRALTIVFALALMAGGAWGQTARQEAKAAEEFDRLYLEQMVGNHQKALKETAAKRAQDPDLKSAAQELVPQIRHQLEMAQRVSAQAAAR